MTENEIIEGILAKDEKAFQEFVETYKDRVLAACYGYVPNTEDAEDISQEVFIEVYRSISKFRGDSSLSTWVYRIAITKSLDFLKSKKRKKRFALFSKEDPSEIEYQLPPELRTPQTQMEDEERIRILHQAIQQLPEQQAKVFTLSKYQGLSNKEIAEILELSLSSVESSMHRAKSNLRQILDDYYKNEMMD